VCCEVSTLIDDNWIIITVVVVVGRVATDNFHFWYLKLQSLCVLWNVSFHSNLTPLSKKTRISVLGILTNSCSFRLSVSLTFILNLLSHTYINRCATSRKVPGSIPGRVNGDFFRGIRQVNVPGVDSAFRNEYQDIPGGNDGRCVGLTTLPP
jgi:hypothetical protein